MHYVKFFGRISDMKKWFKRLKNKLFNSIDIESVINNRQKFNELLYTPIDEAIAELKKRSKDDSIKSPFEIPSAFKNGLKAVLHRQLVTPNYEVLRFVSIADGMELDPVFFEYTADKFVTENDWKYKLGCQSFYFGQGKKGGIKVKDCKVIDFNKSNGKKISEVKTLWGQPLIDFHHELFLNRFPYLKDNIFDGSEWYKKNGGNAKEYYKPFLSFFIKHGILFENFLLDYKELAFTKEVFLPAFLEIQKETGLKPLVVALEPTETEEDVFWLSHPPHFIEDVEKIKNRVYN